MIHSSACLLPNLRYIYILLTKFGGRTGKILAEVLTVGLEGQYFPSTFPSKFDEEEIYCTKEIYYAESILKKGQDYELEKARNSDWETIKKRNLPD